MKPSKQEGNYFAELTLQVISGPNTGDTGVHRLNLVNAEDRAVKIAQRQLSSLCRVTGVWNPSNVETTYVGLDNEEHHGSEIKKFLDVNGNPPTTDSSKLTSASPAKPSFAPAPKTAKPSFAGDGGKAPESAPQPGWKPNPVASAADGEKPSWMKAKS